VYANDEVQSVEGFVIDITERKQYETALETLTEATRQLVGLQARDAICEVVVETAADVLSLRDAGVYLYDPEQNRLEGAPPVQQPADWEDGPVRLDEKHVLVEVLTGTEWRLLDDAELGANDDAGEASQGVLLVPLADHGVLVLVADASGQFGETEFQLVSILSNAAEAALSRLATETELTANEAELEEQNRRLREINRLTDLVRDVNRSLVQAQTRSELERAVCERITDHEALSFAWVGAPEPAGDSLTVRASAGPGRGYLDERTIGTGADENEPAGVAVHRNAAVVTNVTDLPDREWRRQALRRNFLAVSAVPLSYGETTFGVLAVYANDQAAFTDTATEMLSDLGETLGYAIDSFERKAVRRNAPVVEAEFHIADESHVLAELAAALGCRVTLHDVQLEADRTVGFLTVATADEDDVEGAVDRTAGLELVRVTGGGESETTMQVRFHETTVARTLADRGGRLGEARSDGTDVVLTVRLLKARDVRELSRALSSRYRDVELAARRELEETSAGDSAPGTPVDDLTERQHQILRAAYYGGYFESPRGITGEGLAEAFDISPQAINQHLRRIERAVFGRLLGDSGPRPPGG
jgi:predicted DNA binding protein